MHTVVVVAIGLLLLGACVLTGHALAVPAAAARAALWFLPLWLIGSGINMYIGVRSAGYAVSEELPVLLVVFSIPAAAALVAWWKLRH